MFSENPIGVFDSGAGGLCVLREIRQLLPHEHLIYVADSAHIPYGERSQSFIEQRALIIADFFVREGVKAIVVACNTATSAAVEKLRATYALPIVAMEPAIKPAAALTQSGVIGVLATNGTLAGERFANLRQRHGHGVEIIVQPCPGWVELVESGLIDSANALSQVERYVTPLLARGADTLVLGCTHYPFLRGLIETIAGKQVTIVDPSPAVARELQRRLAHLQQLNREGAAGSVSCWTSGNAVQASATLSRLWGQPIVAQPLPKTAN